MSSQVSRMQFLQGDFKGKETPLRPPWVINETLFTEICTNCGECRNCHNFEFMDFPERGRRAVKAHDQSISAGTACIDCHKGIAHELPDMHDVDPGSSIGEI